MKLDRREPTPHPCPSPSGRGIARRSATPRAGRDQSGFRSSPIASSSSCMASSIASQLVAKRSPSSAMSCVQPWQKAPRQALTHPVVQRVLTPQAGQVIATRECALATRRVDLIRRPGNTAGSRRGAAATARLAAPRSYAVRPFARRCRASSGL
jgi:hypothetical protein